MVTGANVSARMVATATRYTGPAIVAHWLGALLIFCGFALGYYMTGLGLSPAKLRYFAWHKWIGITVFLVGAARIAWRLRHPPPPLPTSTPAWQVRAARGMHLLLYVLMFVIPVSGYLYSSATGVSVVYLNVLPLPDLVAKNRELASVLKAIHLTLNYTLALLVVFHIGAALKHQFVDRDGVLARMWPGRGDVRRIDQVVS